MRKVSVCFVAMVMAFGIASSASGSLQVGTKVKMDTSLPGGVGGQFGVIDPGNPAGYGFDYFRTFCAEITQTIANNGVYYVNAISSTGNSTGKTLGDQAAFLYTQFSKGIISPVTDALANGLQYGIWLGMGYDHTDIAVAIGAGTAGIYKTAWDANSAAWLAGSGSWTGIGNVRIMQLGDSINGPANRQDQLIIVPEFSTIAVWSILSAIGGVVAYRRRLVQ